MVHASPGGGPFWLLLQVHQFRFQACRRTPASALPVRGRAEVLLSQVARPFGSAIFFPLLHAPFGATSYQGLSTPAPATNDADPDDAARLPMEDYAHI